jgi:hypothetical protein
MYILAHDDNVTGLLAQALSGDDAQVRAENMVRTQGTGDLRVPIVSNGRDGAMIWLIRAIPRWLITDFDPRLP